MNQDILITEAKMQDFKLIWDLFHSVIAKGDTYAYSPDTSKDEALNLWMTSKTAVYLATYQHKVVGTYFIKENQPGLGSHIANAAYMVHPQFQGRGIGLAIALHSLTKAKELGFQAMQFNLVVSSNKPAIHLWNKLGFKTIGTVPKGFRHAKLGLIDALIMYKDLNEV